MWKHHEHPPFISHFSYFLLFIFHDVSGISLLHSSHAKKTAHLVAWHGRHQHQRQHSPQKLLQSAGIPNLWWKVMMPRPKLWNWEKTENSKRVFHIFSTSKHAFKTWPDHFSNSSSVFMIWIWPDYFWNVLSFFFHFWFRLLSFHHFFDFASGFPFQIVHHPLGSSSPSLNGKFQQCRNSAYGYSVRHHDFQKSQKTSKKDGGPSVHLQMFTQRFWVRTSFLNKNAEHLDSKCHLMRELPKHKEQSNPEQDHPSN